MFREVGALRELGEPVLKVMKPKDTLAWAETNSASRDRVFCL